MAGNLPTIAGFWFGSDLSWLESLCIQSYLDNGHHFVLYVDAPIAHVPVGTDIRPATDIFWPAPFDISDNDRLRVAVFSDLFRLHLFCKTEFIWVDLDAYCVRPFAFDDPYVFGCTHSGAYPTGVLRLPAASNTLGAMLHFVMSKNPTQPWRGSRLHRRNAERYEQGDRWGIETLPWGSSGPKAFGHYLRKSGEDKHAMPAETFYPLTPDELWQLHSPKIRAPRIEGSEVYSVHVYGHQKKWLANHNSGQPVSGSYLETLCDRHRIDPRLNPIPQLKWMKEKAP